MTYACQVKIMFQNAIQKPGNNSHNYPVVFKAEQNGHTQERKPGKGPHEHGLEIRFKSDSASNHQ